MKRSPLLSRTATQIRPPVFADLQARVDRLAASGAEIVPLHIGDTWLAPPEQAMAVLGEVDSHASSLYRYGPTAGLPDLREAVATAQIRHGVRVDPQGEILVANGATHALFCAARAVLDPGDEVLLASPYWPLAPGIFTSCGASLVEVPLTQRLYEDPLLDAGSLFATAITPRTKAIYLISPNNPDGKVLARRDLERVAAVAIEHDLWVFSDEVYADTIFAGRHTAMASIDGMRDRTISLHSVSKSHALAGCRVGFAIAPSPVIASARRVSTHTAFNVSVLMQNVARAALADETFPRVAAELYREGRDRALQALEGEEVIVHRAEGATYLFVDFAPAFAAMGPALAGARPLLSLLERAVDRGVLLTPGDAFGSGYETCARLCTAAASPEHVVLGIERLRDALAAMKQGKA